MVLKALDILLIQARRKRCGMAAVAAPKICREKRKRREERKRKRVEKAKKKIYKKEEEATVMVWSTPWNSYT